MAESDGDKSQEPTPFRRQEAREKGQVAQSQDLGSAVLLIVSSAALLWLGKGLVQFLMDLASAHLAGEGWLVLEVSDFVTQWQLVAAQLAWSLLPILGIVFLAAIAVNMAQVGLLFLPEKLIPDIQRIDPIQGFQRIFSLAGVVRLAFGLLKIVVVGAVAYVCITQVANTVLELVGLELGVLGRFLGEVSLWTCLKIGIALFILAILDFGFQYWKREQDLRMTPQEVREEVKRLQGDPQVAARRRVVQRQLAMHRLSSDVKKADVVVTNPTELAVAIQYDAKTMAAPIVLAKGAGTIAQRIRQIALENGIPIVERKPLAQALYRDVDVGRAVPSKLYAAVAEVLAYVYQLKGKPLPHT